MNKKVFFAGLLIISIAAYNLLVAYVDKQLESKDYSGVYNSCHKVWAARGLYNTRQEQNTPEAMMRAFSLGANGAEVDVHYDRDLKEFIVSHDHPKKGLDGKLIYTKKNGSLLSLEDFFKMVGKDRYFWLDFKNLGQFDKEETSEIIKNLEKVTQFDSLKERVYVEGSNPILLSQYTDAGFKTILGIHPIRESLFSSSFVINVYKLGFYFSNITVIGMAYGKDVNDPVYGPTTKESLKNTPLFLFHVPDNEALIKSLMKDDAVKVVLVGKDLSINRYAINACSSTNQ